MAIRPKKDRRAMIFRTVVILVIVACVGAFAIIKMQNTSTVPDTRNDLAQCLTDKGVKMYGAYWCPHCAQQKKDFGKAFSKVTYVECAVQGSPQTQTQACKDAGITGYPTWVFANGDRLSGEQPLATLSDKAGCAWKP
jgi:hypothetical protein